MAKKVTVNLVDDYDGESIATETVTFSIDGIGYEIDLNDKHATEMRADIDKWVQHARKVHGRTIRRRPTGANSSGLSHDIREWAKANGHAVPSRGRVKAEVVRAYHAAQAKAQATQTESKDEKPAVRRASTAKKTAEAPEFSAANA